MTYPLPVSRGRWRLTIHPRAFVLNAAPYQNAIGELTGARSRSVVQAWNTPAQLTFTIDGHSPEASLLSELMTDVVAWRWDEKSGQDQLVFRGVITGAEDQLTEQSHTVNITCMDYLAMMNRRILTTPLTVTQRDQDDLVGDLLSAASYTSASSGAGFSPGSFLPLLLSLHNPDGSGRAAKSGQLRDRTYLGNQIVYEALSDLAAVIGGFDYDTQPNTGSADILRVFYPYQGVQRTDLAYVYGSTVSAVTRTVNSGDYANYWRVLGNNASSDPADPQMYSEAWNADANNVTVVPIGLWMSGDNAADVSIQSTLDQQAQGNLALSGQIVPSYSLTLRPGVYSWGNPNMGDVVPLVVQSGRLGVNTNLRVLGITYNIGDDGQEDVSLTVGRPLRTLTQLINRPVQDVDALVRR